MAHDRRYKALPQRPEIVKFDERENQANKKNGVDSDQSVPLAEESWLHCERCNVCSRFKVKTNDRKWKGETCIERGKQLTRQHRSIISRLKMLENVTFNDPTLELNSSCEISAGTSSLKLNATKSAPKISSQSKMLRSRRTYGRTDISHVCQLHCQRCQLRWSSPPKELSLPLSVAQFQPKRRCAVKLLLAMPLSPPSLSSKKKWLACLLSFLLLSDLFEFVDRSSLRLRFPLSPTNSLMRLVELQMLFWNAMISLILGVQPFNKHRQPCCCEKSGSLQLSRRSLPRRSQLWFAHRHTYCHRWVCVLGLGGA